MAGSKCRNILPPSLLANCQFSILHSPFSPSLVLCSQFSATARGIEEEQQRHNKQQYALLACNMLQLPRKT